jgi:F-type H+-transporting ATPase subunit b
MTSAIFSAFLSVVLAAEGGLLSVDRSFFVTVIVFLVLLLALNTLVFNPILAVLDKREKLTTGSVQGAQHLLQDIDRRTTEYETKLRAARVEAYKAVEVRRAEALQARSDMMQRVKDETGTQVAQAKQELSAQVTAAKVDLTAEAERMAAAISTAILGRQVGN